MNSYDDPAHHRTRLVRDVGWPCVLQTGHALNVPVCTCNVRSAAHVSLVALTAATAPRVATRAPSPCRREDQSVRRSSQASSDLLHGLK